MEDNSDWQCGLELAHSKTLSLGETINPILYYWDYIGRYDGEVEAFLFSAEN